MLTTEAEYKTWFNKRIPITTSLNFREIVKVARKKNEEIQCTCKHPLNEPPDPTDIDLDKLPDKMTHLSKLVVNVRTRWIKEAIDDKEVETKEELFDEVAHIERKKDAITSREQHDHVIEKSGCCCETHPNIKKDFLNKVPCQVSKC